MHDQLPSTNWLNTAAFFYDRFYSDESGQDLIEYALLAAMVGLGSVSGTQNMASAVANEFTHIQTAVTNAIPAAPGGGGGNNGGGGGNNGGGGGGRGGGGGGRNGGGGGRGGGGGGRRGGRGGGFGGFGGGRRGG